ncbi:potassium channel family protein [Hippea maritima]|uniref:TrkA-N domain protein n=1 Tax=Hippea maritima (strain ATCC 700847 / DSM 10411 / MH2) TaxID=760142 RepID=F2LUU6_HIPMA|nr:potassium channel protein [Hippea maritima]AEA33551.1 TrkA-N domain protein [Hippea maritima DSM 10411]
MKKNKEIDIQKTFYGSSKSAKLYRFSMQITTAISLLAIVGYDNAIPIYIGSPKIYKILEIITIFAFTFDFILKTILAFEKANQKKKPQVRLKIPLFIQKKQASNSKAACIISYFLSAGTIANILAIIPYDYLPYPYRILILIARILKGASFSKSVQELTEGLKEKAFEISIVFVIFFFIIMGSSIVMLIAEGHRNPNIRSIFDAIWWSIVTFTTVGYGDITPITPIGRGVASFLMVMGISGIALLTGIVSSAFTDRILKLKLNTEEIMEKKIEKLSKHFIICGFGRVGKVVAKEMERFKKKFVIIEENPESAREAIENGYLVIIGSATDEEILKKARVKEAQGIALVMDSDADNIYTLITAKDENKNILAVARANSEDSVKKFVKLGAKTISPYQSSGYDISRMLISPKTAELVSIVMQSDTTIEMGEFYITKKSPYAGKKIKETDIRSKYNLIIIAMIGKDKTTKFNPKANDIIEIGSTLICVGTKEDMEKFEQIISQSSF